MTGENKTALLFALLVALSATAAAADVSASREEDGLFRSKVTHVTVENSLPPGGQFTIHCKSKDDDLGTHVIPVTSEYKFQFRVNLHGTTLFFCGIQTTFGQGVYDIYKASRDEIRCLNCRWEVRKDGVYGFKEGHEFGEDIYFPWK